MKLALAAGGTGGHMFPAQSLAEEAKARGWSVLLLTDARGKRYTDGFPADHMVELQAASPSARGLLAKAKAAVALLGGIQKASGALKHFEADAVIGFGGYPSAPAMLAAQRRGIPTGIHEQNAVLGRANRLAVGKAGFLAHGFPVLDRSPSGVQIVEVGNPVRQAVHDATMAAYASPESGPLKVLVFGGSQGASLFARIFAPAMAALPAHLRQRLLVTHQVGEDDHEAAAAIYAEAGIEAELAPFFKDLPARIAGSHLVIARSGASSVSELSVIGRPSVLVPLKIAMDDHQRMNAEVLTEAGAAERILEDDLTVESATATLTSLLSEPQRLTAMAEAAKGRMAAGAASTLADLTEKLVAGDLSR
ncbi:MAG: UDP-N-acetylglucosamine--N-acetylmuramyl-(pentapeptide) pyrophosphoryl-undecaprenol N-acetylglucosamine transferase [Parvularculaceae bacterium]|nr:UDP-N-acetylglucosamine--N-acetylmuramyl-(pentapeptide) pyrophosphoryl-undecaprenol N-acetylglucosamine transferase [Parvularculaceae bacterium]